MSLGQLNIHQTKYDLKKDSSPAHSRHWCGIPAEYNKKDEVPNVLSRPERKGAVLEFSFSICNNAVYERLCNVAKLTWLVSVFYKTQSTCLSTCLYACQNIAVDTITKRPVHFRYFSKLDPTLRLECTYPTLTWT